MAYYLLEDGVSKYVLEDGSGDYLLDAGLAQRRHFWQILIFDQNNHLVDIPQSDIEQWSCKSLLNGGYGAGQLVFVRDFNKIGQLGYGYSVLIWFWTEGQPKPLDPWYSGTLNDELDQEQLDARGRITVNVRGDMELLNAGIVTSTVTGGIGGVTPMPDAAAYMNVLVTTYQPPNFIAPSLPASMFQLWPLQFDGTGLASCIDTVTKQSLDGSGHQFIWFVRTNRFLQRQVVVELDLNPNWNTAAPKFSTQFPGVTCDQYKIETIYRNIQNVVSIYGGKDPVTGQQIFGVFNDATSIAAFTAREVKLSVPALLSTGAVQSYAQTWLAQNSSPQAQGSARILDPDPTIVPGRWMQFCETPANSSSGVVLKQVRLAEVDVACDGQRVQMTVTTNSPTPYLDDAIYRLGLNVAAAGAIAIKPLPVNTQQLFVIGGGVVVAASSSPAKITISAVTLVFPSTGQIVIAALPSTLVADSTTSATGDGDYTVYATSASAFNIVKGTPAAMSATQQILAKVAVVAGTAFVTDARTLMAQPAIDTSQQPVVTGSVTLGSVPFLGGGAYDQPVTFSLVAPYGTTQNTGLMVLQLGWRANGGTNAIAQSGTDILPNATGVGYTGTILGIGAGTAVDIYVRGVDTHGLATAWTFLATTTAQNINVGPSSLFVTGTIASGSYSPGSTPNITVIGTFNFTAPAGGTYTVQGSLNAGVTASSSGGAVNVLAVTLVPTAGSFSGLTRSDSEGGFISGVGISGGPAQCQFTVAAGVTITMSVSITVGSAPATVTVTYQAMQWLMQLIRTGN